MRKPVPDELLDMCVSLVSGAAELVRGARRAGMSVGTKSTATDLVTDVDTRCEQWLREQILTRRPDDAILGEEAAGSTGSSGVRWLVDPIDGTVNFVLGIPLYAVSVAAEVDGEVVAGAVANPVSGELFRASRGGGAFCGDQRLAGPRVIPLERAVVATGFGYDARLRTGQGAVAAQLLARIADIRRLGCAALDLCFLAAGRLDAYFESGLHVWDYAAGGLVVAEAGGVVSGLRGRAPSTRLYAAAGPALAPAFFGLLETLGADEAGTSLE
ncbi:MAG TPA: inositol monophosphatase family protein [Jatrophihabitans sp.]|nr:inositol monophosphatase family protein [Jatrophihabitans sp.]